MKRDGWLDIAWYRDFRDVPRLVCARVADGEYLLLDCPFEDARDEYATAYRVSDVSLPGTPTEDEIIAAARGCVVREVPVAYVDFDPTLRARVRVPHLAIKDEEREHPIASAWRADLVSIVDRLVRGEYPRPQIRTYIASYGETLVPLPEETWDTSVAQWIGTHWVILVDLWTRESGASDLVLHANVFETDDGYRIEAHSVYVP